MSEPASDRSLKLEQFPETLAVVRLGPGAEVPSWAESSSLFSITATARETSLVCARRSVPKKAQQAGPFTAFAVDTAALLALSALTGSLLLSVVAARMLSSSVNCAVSRWPSILWR